MLPTQEELFFRERVPPTPPTARLALALCQSPGFLRHLFTRLEVPEGAEQVVFALEEPEGPYLVLSRQGEYRTCLEKGEPLGEAPVVEKSKLEGLLAREPSLKSRLQKAKQELGKEGLGSLLVNMQEKGEAFSREEFLVYASWYPVLGPQFLQTYLSALLRMELGFSWLKKTPRGSPLYEEGLHTYFQLLFSASHLAVLSALGGMKPWVEEIRRGAPRLSGSATFSSWLTRQAMGAVALRGLWGAGRLGPALLPEYRQALRKVTLPVELYDILAGLTVIGLGHPEQREEVGKELSLFARAGEGLMATPELVRALFEDPEKTRRMHMDISRPILLDHKERLPKNSSYRLSTPEEVPEGLALAMFARSNMDFLNRREGTVAFFSAMPWLATARPEELYLPAALLEELLPSTLFFPDRVLKFLARQDPSFLKPEAPPTRNPGRNEPCTCGSGKKYKKCCGLN